MPWHIGDPMEKDIGRVQKKKYYLAIAAFPLLT
jgi:hypothetical protein